MRGVWPEMDDWGEKTKKKMGKPKMRELAMSGVW